MSKTGDGRPSRRVCWVEPSCPANGGRFVDARPRTTAASRSHCIRTGSPCRRRARHDDGGNRRWRRRDQGQESRRTSGRPDPQTWGLANAIRESAADRRQDFLVGWRRWCSPRRSYPKSGKFRRICASAPLVRDVARWQTRRSCSGAAVLGRTIEAEIWLPSRVVPPVVDTSSRESECTHGFPSRRVRTCAVG